MIRGLKPKVKTTLWVGSIAVVIVIGLFYFPREYKDAGFWQTLYFTLRLFVFEHDLPTFPKSWPLIFIYFLAPVITISAVGTAISYLFRLPPAIKTRWMSDHAVVCGMGRTGKLFASALKKKGIQVVGVDRGPLEDFEEWCDQHRVPMIFGDFNSDALLKKMGASRARSIIFASGDDLANLEGALSAYEWLQTDEGPVRLIWAQIANDHLANTARAAVRTSGKVGIRFFDTYRIAALRMIANYFDRNLRKEVSEVNILGFGKFGRDLLDVLVHDLYPGEKFNIRVTDVQDRKSAVLSLAEELGVAERVTYQKTDLQDLRLGGQVERAYFICTDDDLGNLTAAMSLACDVKTTHIFVRMDRWPLSGVADNLGQDRGVLFINIHDLVVEGIEDLPGIFGPAQASDLKRAKLGRSSVG
jgi:voltage-gated potassium channel Kch